MIEGVLVVLVAKRFAWPVKPILGTSIVANILTQGFLWAVLSTFYLYYWPALLISEVIIWLAESIMYAAVAANGLKWSQAWRLSLGLNLTTFLLGLVLPV